MNLRKNYFNIFIYAVKKNIEDDDLKKKHSSNIWFKFLGWKILSMFIHDLSSNDHFLNIHWTLQYKSRFNFFLNNVLHNLKFKTIIDC